MKSTKVKKMYINISVNLVIAIIFILLNKWALKNRFEETFIALAMFYGLITIIVNSLFFVEKDIRNL